MKKLFGKNGDLNMLIKDDGQLFGPDGNQQGYFDKETGYVYDQLGNRRSWYDKVNNQTYNTEGNPTLWQDQNGKLYDNEGNEIAHTE